MMIDRTSQTLIGACAVERVALHDKTRCRPSLRIRNPPSLRACPPATLHPYSPTPTHREPPCAQRGASGEVIDTEADVTPSQMEVDIRMKRCSNEHALSDRRERCVAAWARLLTNVMMTPTLLRY